MEGIENYLTQLSPHALAGKGADKSYGKMLVSDMIRNKYIYIMALPVILYYLIFCYQPMYGAIIAFKEFSPGKGILGSPWVGLRQFSDFFKSFYFWRVIKNTILISVYDLVFGFPAPIFLALLINEIRQQKFKKLVQTVTYLPHFISIMVVCGMIIDFTSSGGLINDIVVFFGGTRSTLLLNPSLFKPIYIITNIWQSVGWGTIIYLSAMTAIDPQLYESASIDGASHLSQIIHITLPGIVPIIVILLILRIGQMMNVGFEKIILLYNPLTYNTADVISSYVYREGLQNFNYSYSTAVGLFNSVINFVLLLSANKLSKAVSGSSLW